jgi:hypothetical protein
MRYRMSRVYLGTCAIVRNESPYIAEWIEFNRMVGVERFWIYDDGSVDDTVAILNSMNRGDITVTPWGFGHEEYACTSDGSNLMRCMYGDTPQITSFNHCTINHRDEAVWCMFHDPDEYIYHATEDDLRVPLSDLEQFSGLFIHWLTFGTSGHKTRPDCLTIEAYTHRGPVGGVDPWGRQGKAIVRLAEVVSWGNFGSHNAVFKNGFGACVDENGLPICVGGSRAGEPMSNDRWRLNHYFTRSEEEYRAKATKIDHNAKPAMQTPHAIEEHNQNQVEDRDILRFAPELRRRLGL